jgi:hypothetical protein
MQLIENQTIREKLLSFSFLFSFKNVLSFKNGRHIAKIRLYGVHFAKGRAFLLFSNFYSITAAACRIRSFQHMACQR